MQKKLKLIGIVGMATASFLILSNFPSTIRWLIISSSLTLYILYKSENILWIRVNEFEVDVIYKSELNQFSRFLGTGFHIIAPYFETVKNTIDTNYKTLNHTVELKTFHGQLINIPWEIQYYFNPLLIQDKQVQARMARTLSTRPENTLTSSINLGLQTILHRYTAKQLIWQYPIIKLPDQLLKYVESDLIQKGIVPLQVLIHKIKFSAQVEKSIAKALESKILTEAQSSSLSSLLGPVQAIRNSEFQKIARIKEIEAIGKANHSSILVKPSEHSNTSENEQENLIEGLFFPDRPQISEEDNK